MDEEPPVDRPFMENLFGEELAITRTRPFAVILLTHIVLAVLLFEPLALTAICMWTPARWLQSILVLLWLVLMLSPLVGLAALQFRPLRFAYLIMLSLMVLQFLVVMELNRTEVLLCDGP